MRPTKVLVIWLLVTLAITALIAGLAAGSADAKKVRWHTGGATVYSDGCNGSYRNVCNAYSFAELGGLYKNTATRMGGLAGGTKVRFILPNGRKVTGRKGDHGLGGPPIGGFPRVADLRCELLQRGGIYDCQNWSAVVKWRVVR